jgi:hypothetical protein
VSELSEVESTTVAALEVLEEELTEQEEADRHRLELKVERAFFEAGKALQEIRARRLYRSTHKTFEEYCRDRFGHSRQRSNYLIAAADVYENLTTICCQNSEPEDLTKKRTQILPTNEGQVRPLAKLEPEQQRQVWEEAVDLADGKVPTGKIVKGIVERLKEKPLFLAANFCSVGDVFTLSRLEGAERKYNGCWAIASELRDFTVIVNVHDGNLTVKPENLKPIDSPDVRRQLPATLKRIKRVRNAGLLDRGAYYVLEGLGRQTYLTEVEDGLLTWLEEYYRANSPDS